MRQRTNYALNDFDDNYSIDDIDHLSVMSGSTRNLRFSSGVPFIEANHLAPSSKVMADMEVKPLQMTGLPTIQSPRDSHMSGGSLPPFEMA